MHGELRCPALARLAPMVGTGVAASDRYRRARADVEVSVDFEVAASVGEGGVRSHGQVGQDPDKPVAGDGAGPGDEQRRVHAGLHDAAGADGTVVTRRGRGGGRRGPARSNADYQQDEPGP